MQYFGLALLVLILVQSGLGIAVHYVKIKPHRFTAASGRGPSNYIHMVLGVIVVSIGIWTAWKGEPTKECRGCPDQWQV